ncbi:DNA-binding response regulator [Dokdonia pacifica]|uniref:Two component transcriptional regulator, LytTR family n=1 Tax=Dokdonia pacifica TaxID=1627892 RepID=A0A238YVB7_9FLAO|nr:LytTR family DNA-binding domain-containing protein [Dokdonia pacifica]GGG10047.1 DNA-binding response regulator [Dokdonia pacifica]SNR74584.1 two component transcriptional regulator, LytTR family [Dokdonia pacifica]
MLKCIIIDDEELARALLKSYVDKLDFIVSKGAYENPLEALPILKSEVIDVVFLDIQMPQLKGTDFAKMISPTTRVIFTTAYSEYALDGYELNAIDYLLKPITFERFLTAVNKVQTTTRNITDIGSQTITIKSGYDLHKVRLSEIYYIKSDSEYVTFYLDNKKIMSYQSLKSLEDSLPPSLFMRVHRSYIINKNKVQALKDKDIIIQDHRIPVSTTYFETVKKELFS